MTKIRVYDAGRFNRQLSVENRVELPDGCGGFSFDFQSQGTVWARVCPRKPTVQTSDEPAKQEATHTLLMRFSYLIRKNTRLVTGSRKFTVQSVFDPDGTRRYLECLAYEH